MTLAVFFSISIVYYEFSHDSLRESRTEFSVCMSEDLKWPELINFNLFLSNEFVQRILHKFYLRIKFGIKKGNNFIYTIYKIEQEA